MRKIYIYFDESTRIRRLKIYIKNYCWVPLRLLFFAEKDNIRKVSKKSNMLGKRMALNMARVFVSLKTKKLYHNNTKIYCKFPDTKTFHSLNRQILFLVSSWSYWHLFAHLNNSIFLLDICISLYDTYMYM